MPPKRDFKLIGRGVYTIAETARLAKVSVSQVQRWTKGHWYRYRGERRFSPPIIGTGVEKGEESPILQFQDLMEIRFLRAFRHRRVLISRQAAACRRSSTGASRENPPVRYPCLSHRRPDDPRRARLR